MTLQRITALPRVRWDVLLCALLAIFYGVFTLAPNSHSLMVSWPWVAVWQLGLLIGPSWLLLQVWRSRQLHCLGHRLDWVVVSLGLTVALSNIKAPFPRQAWLYSWDLFCLVATLYALEQWLTAPYRLQQRRQRLLDYHGLLLIGLIFVSLSLWLTQTIWPYWRYSQTIAQFGIPPVWNLSALHLRNWHPIGHQNYVAGYLVLGLPVLLGLSLQRAGGWRWVWGSSFGLGLLALYSTGSRGGWLGLCGSLLTFVILSLWRQNQVRAAFKWLVGASILGLILWGATSERLRLLLTAISTGDGSGELAYRIITHMTGWQMGLARPVLGMGLGSVPLVYQAYRPFWAGREAELTYQLHSTPAQIWAELGICGVVTLVIAGGLMGYLCVVWLQTKRRQPRSEETSFALIAGIWSALVGYGLLSLTDYQLDNLCISGALVIYLAVLTSELKTTLMPSQPSSRPVLLNVYHPVTGVMTGLFVALIVLQMPTYLAWKAAHSGFMALQRGDFSTYVQKLERAHRFAPWEPYYLYQLAWNLGDQAYQVDDPQQQLSLQQASQAWFNQALETSPYQEFGYSNLGWLIVNQSPPEAVQSFLKATELVSAKQGLFFGLGYSLLLSGHPQLATEAMVLELLRHPSLVTSPVWQLEQIQPISQAVFTALNTRLTELISKTPEPTLQDSFYQMRGGLAWWRGDFASAEQDFGHLSHPLNHVMTQLALASSNVSSDSIDEINADNLSPLAASALQAWFDPGNRPELLARAWLYAQNWHAAGLHLPPSELLQQVQTSMDDSSTLHEWLTQKAPQQTLRSQRSGLGLIYRHADGPIPEDFYLRLENVPMQTFFGDFLPSYVYNPKFDQALEPLRTKLRQKIAAL